MDIVALAVIDALADRLRAIRVANGYHTDAGANVFLGRLELGDGETPGVSVLEDEDAFEAELNGTSIREAGDYRIQGVIAADAANPLRAGHALVADIKRALMRAPNGAEFEHFEGGPAARIEYRGRQIFQREPGERYCVVIVTFNVAHNEQYGDPGAQA